MQAKMAWKQKHMRDQPITETGLQFLEMDESQGRVSMPNLYSLPFLV